QSCQARSCQRAGKRTVNPLQIEQICPEAAHRIWPSSRCRKQKICIRTEKEMKIPRFLIGTSGGAPYRGLSGPVRMQPAHTQMLMFCDDTGASVACTSVKPACRPLRDALIGDDSN